MSKQAKLKIIPLGGLGEVGKNMTAYEFDRQIIVVDAGIMFPENDMLGIDYIIPDYEYLRQRADQVIGIVITHGHETTAWHCLGGGVLFTPVALVTGLLTWWLNYEWRPLRPILIKLTLTPILLAVGTGTFIWRWLDPGILAALDHWTGRVYLALIFSLMPLVSLIGWYGATLTFPLYEKHEEHEE